MTPTGALPVWARTIADAIAPKPSAHRKQATVKWGNGRLVCMVCIKETEEIFTEKQVNRAIVTFGIKRDSP
jgi:hypothetical protein